MVTSNSCGGCVSFTIMSSTGLNKADHRKLVMLTEIAIQSFDSSDCVTIGAHTNELSYVNGHDRLLKSLSWGDSDYAGCAHTVMNQLVMRDPGNLPIIEDYISRKYGAPGMSISTAPSKGPSISFTPSVFDIPNGGVESDLVAVMTPFAPQFEAVFSAISNAGVLSGFRVLRAKDIWQHSSVIQDVFSLIYRAHIVVCDFTGKNPNVFYEAGIAHTLGKHVVPITQHAGDVPFDLGHHRYLEYLNNGEGCAKLAAGLATRFASLR